MAHRTAIDWAEEIRYLVDVSYPDRNKIILVIDNLNTHTLSSLYKTFPASEARRIEDMNLLRQELAAWESDRNEHTAYI